MIGIYDDSFLEYLKTNLDDIKIKVNSIVTKCPWCEINSNHEHGHLYISLKEPIFHCFYANCNVSGNIKKLIKKIDGNVGLINKFIDPALVSYTKKNNIKSITSTTNEFILPKLNPDRFILKHNYIKNRLGYNIDIDKIPGLVYDIEGFILNNKIIIDDFNTRKLLPFFYNKFIGFLTKDNSKLIVRNIEEGSFMRYGKINIFKTDFLDYYRIKCCNQDSSTIILAEGTFDVLNSYYNNILNLNQSCFMYAAGLSSDYESLIKSVVFNEHIFKLNIHILSDDNIKKDYYKYIKKKMNHVIDKLTIYYNKVSKDFGDKNIVVEKIVL